MNANNLKEMESENMKIGSHGVSHHYWKSYNKDDQKKEILDSINFFKQINLNTNNISAYVNLYGYNPRSEQKDELIGPNIHLDGDSIMLSFQVAYQKFNSSSKQDTLQVFLSSDCGENYNKIFEKGGQDLSTYDEMTVNFIPQSNEQWREETVDLTEFINQKIIPNLI